MAFNKEQFIEDLKVMSVLDLNELVKTIEEEFGVSAAAPVAVAAADGTAAEDDGKRTVVLAANIGQKMKIIQELRKINSDLSLADAKALFENGGNVKEDVSVEEAGEVAERLKALEAEIEVK